MKLLIEIEVNYPDLSMSKHIAMLKALFKQNKVFGVKTVRLVESNYIPIYPDKENRTKGEINEI